MLTVSGETHVQAAALSLPQGPAAGGGSPPVDVSDWPTRTADTPLARTKAPAQSPARTGESAPDVRTHALLAQDVYNDTASPPPGYRQAGSGDLAMLGLTPSKLENGEFRARVYVTGTGEDTRYVVAFRGTQSPEGWASNVHQGLGTGSAHYTDALRLGEQIAASGLAGRVSFAGHSLGGGLAATASIATGAPAHTFNAAGLHDNTIGAANAIRAAYGIEASGNVQAWHVRGEVLSSFQDGGDRAAGWAIGGFIGAWLADAPEAYGERHALDPVAPEGKGFFDRIDPVDRHGMDWVINSLPR